MRPTLPPACVSRQGVGKGYATDPEEEEFGKGGKGGGKQGGGKGGKGSSNGGKGSSKGGKAGLKKKSMVKSGGKGKGGKAMMMLGDESSRRKLGAHNGNIFGDECEEFNKNDVHYGGTDSRDGDGDTGKGKAGKGGDYRRRMLLLHDAGFTNRDLEV